MDDVVEELLKIVVESLQTEEGNLNNAVDLATDFSRRKSIDSDLLLYISKFFGSKHSHELAYIFAKTTVNLSTGSTKAYAHSIAGVASYLLDSMKEAEEQYKLALEIDPKSVDTHSNYGILLVKMRRFKEAEEQYKLALKEDPNHVRTHLSYGNLLQEMGRKEEAEEQYLLALEIDPKHVNTHYSYGILLAEMGRQKRQKNNIKSP